MQGGPGKWWLQKDAQSAVPKDTLAGTECNKWLSIIGVVGEGDRWCFLESKAGTSDIQIE